MIEHDLGAGIGCLVAALAVSGRARYLCKCLAVGAAIAIIEAAWLALLGYGAAQL